MDRPRISTVVSAALASAAAFYVITRSGLAGTLAGAAVASVVYTATSHGVRTAAERLRSGRKRTAEGAVESAVESMVESAAEPKGPPLMRMVSTWGPVLLAVVALVAALYSMYTGTPPERVVVHERVVEKPVVTERVVVQTKTVTVTQPPQGGGGNASPAPTSTSTTLGAAVPGATPTTTTLATPTTSTTNAVPPVPTTNPTATAP